ncbi:MAG: phage holin family protein, partial [Acidimicrobiia bacterium]
MAWIIPGLSVSGWEALVLAVGVISMLNALLWPIIARYAAGLILITLGLLGLVLNGLFLMLAAEIVPGFDVSSLWVAIVGSLGMTAVSAILG